MLSLQMQPPVYAGSSPDPASKAAPAPLPVIIVAERAHVGGAAASSGTTVYPGDVLDTEPGGELRFAVGPGQAYLLSDSAANVRRAGAGLRASIHRGTVGFSGLNADQFQIETPEGLVHAANGLPAYGQVTITGPKDIVISAYTGALALERGNQRLVVNAGQSYYVSLVPDAEPPPQRRAGVTPALNEHLVWRLIVIGGAALAGYFLWRHFSMSPVDP
jgi:hypothetical protein